MVHPIDMPVLGKRRLNRNLGRSRPCFMSSVVPFFLLLVVLSRLQRISAVIAWQTSAALHLTVSFASDGKKPTTPSSQPTEGPKNTNARYAATKALIPRKGSSMFSLDRLEGDVVFQQLSVRDRSFAKLILATLERRRGQIDIILKHCMNEKQKKRPSRVDMYIHAVLQVGATQLLFLETSPHAAVKETVDILKIDPTLNIPEKKIKFANAVLRRISRESQELLSMTNERDNVAAWLVESWDETWGPACTDKIIQAAMTESPRCISIKEGIDIESVASQFDDVEILPHRTLRIRSPPSGPISEWPKYGEGIYWFQDFSATLPAYALRKRLEPQMSKTVVDMCAAPGGKTSQLASFGFDVQAIEISPHRTKRLQQNLQRLGFDSCSVVTADATSWVPSALVDGVLLDVPCSATGTASKRPDVLRRSSDLSELHEIQQRLLCHTLDNVVKVGGVVIYATCSLLKSESEDQITRILDRDSGGRAKLVPFVQEDFPSLQGAIDNNGYIRMIPGQLPELGQYDGFFVAQLLRIE